MQKSKFTQYGRFFFLFCFFSIIVSTRLWNDLHAFKMNYSAILLGSFTNQF